MAPNTSEPVTKKPESFQQDEGALKSRVIGSTKQAANENRNESGSSEQSNFASLGNKVTDGVENNQEKTVFKPRIRWPDLMAQVFVHVGSTYGLYFLITLQAKFYTYIWCKFSFECRKL